MLKSIASSPGSTNHSFQSTSFLPLNSTGIDPSSSAVTFPVADFANDTQRHAMQILATVGATFSFPSPYNFLPFLPPLPPAPPSFTLVPNAYPSQPAPSSHVSHRGRHSPPTKRRHDENSKENRHTDDDKKRKRHESHGHHRISSHNFDEENIALVPSLVDANINTLNK
jgi:hypothetical protein